MKKISLTQNRNTTVDDEDYDKLSKYKWTFLNVGTGYAIRWSKGGVSSRRIIYMHREIINPPEGKIVDHINSNSLDNQRKNLRICTRSENAQNSKKRLCNTSGFKGVFRDRGRWRVMIGLNGELIHIGCYGNLIEAARAYDKAAHKLFGNFAHINFQE